MLQENPNLFVELDGLNAHRTFVDESFSNSLEEGKNTSFWNYIKSKRNASVGVSAIKNKGRFCNTIASVALVHTSIQSD